MREIVTVIQARSGSSRLPGKVLLPLGQSTVLEEMLVRVRAARLAGEVIVATTESPEDDRIIEICRRLLVPTVRGHETDLLARHAAVLERFPAEAVVKIPSDCPLIDPKVIDRVIGFYLTNKERFDYVSNLHPQSYPDGNDVEVMRNSVLLQAYGEATRPIDREHTTPYLWDNPDKFRIGNVKWERGLDLSRDFRWTLDYPEDYELIRTVFDNLSGKIPMFTVDDIVELVASHPEIRRLNAERLGDAWYQRHKQELNTQL